jgi:hypothetical protein
VNETEHLGAFLGSLYHKTASVDKFFLHVQSDRKDERKDNYMTSKQVYAK